MVASVTFCPPVSTRWSLPLCPLMSVAHKEFCATLCSGRKNRIKILNLSSPVLVNNAIYYCGWDILWGGEEQAYFGLELKSYCITAPTCGLSYSNYSPCRVMESKEGINSGGQGYDADSVTEEQIIIQKLAMTSPLCPAHGRFVFQSWWHIYPHMHYYVFILKGIFL